jgi:hypothetical protein
VVQDRGPNQLIVVKTGLVADDWITIVAGSDGGETIRVPADAGTRQSLRKRRSRASC